LAGVAHVEAIVGPSKSTNEQSLLSLSLAKSLFRLIPLFWTILSSSMLLLPSFWMIKFSGVLHELKGELLILNRNADENGALTVKGGGFVWNE
jgi:hypothetical protein